MSEEDERGKELDRLEESLEYRFANRSLLETSLRHASYTHEKAKGGTAEGDALENNERLEFLGDAVLGLVVADALYRAKPDWREGDLTRGLHALVEGRSLSSLARSFDLGGMILLGRTERRSGGEDKASILENAMEAVIGAIYLDGGILAATAFLDRAFGDALSANAAPVRRDPKSEFQEKVMEVEGEFPRYRVVHDSAIEGDEARFTVEVFLRDSTLARGTGRTKRAAERLAAQEALVHWYATHPVEV